MGESKKQLHSLSMKRPPITNIEYGQETIDSHVGMNVH